MAVNGDHGVLILDAGENIHLTGSTLEALGDRGSLILHAGKDITLDIDTLSARKDMTENRDNYIRTYRKTEMGNTLMAGKDMTLSSGGNLSARSSTMASERGKIILAAGDDVTLSNGYNEARDDYGLKYKEKGFLSGKITAVKSHDEEKKASPVIISGDSISILSGKDTGISASQIIAPHDVTAAAGGNIHIFSAPEYESHDYEKQVKKRGLLSGGGLGFTMGSEKRKDRSDSEAVEQVGSTIGSVEGSVRISAGKNAAILGSEVTAGKDIFISGENINLQHTENTYSSLEKHEMARSGLSVSLGGRTVETVHSIAAPLMRAGEVEDARLKGLYALQAGQTAGQLIREEKDAGYVVESLRHNASESANVWEKARDWDTADRIENSRLGKKNSFALDIALGSSKNKSEIESTAHVIKGSMIHGENTVSVRADKDISVSGSRIEGKDVNLEAGRHILITAGENSTEEKQNTHSTSGNMGVYLGVEGIQGIRGGYSSGKGKEEETSRTYEDSRIKAENTLNFVSGKDTAVKGGKLEGDRVKGGVGGSLSLETVQDEKSYHEESHSAGITLSYDFSHGKSGLSGGLSKENIQSHYESASSQSGIYAGYEGFDISVKDNTHLKGAVIDSKGDADKNTLRTGTLSWEDVENKADYRLIGKGIAVNKTPNAPYNEKGVTPAIPTGSSGKADSTTRAGIAPGTIMIQDKDNQRQDMAALNRNTRDSLNKLGEIFNKTKVEERQELAGLFGKLAFNYLHDAKLTPNQRAAWHAVISGIMGQLSNKDFIAGALPAGINEMMIGEIQKAAHGDPALMQWIGACVGVVAGQLVSGHSQIGGSAAASGVKNNDTLMTPEEMSALVFGNGRAEVYLQSIGKLPTSDNIELIKSNFETFINKYNGSDAVMASVSIGGAISQETDVTFDLKGVNHSLYMSTGMSVGVSPSPINITFAAVKLVALNPDINLDTDKVRSDIFEGISASSIISAGIAVGAQVPINSVYSGQVAVYLVGIATPQVGMGMSTTDNTNEKVQDIENAIKDNPYGLD